jgi:hypothetical protein
MPCRDASSMSPRSIAARIKAYIPALLTEATFTLDDKVAQRLIDAASGVAA